MFFFFILFYQFFCDFSHVFGCMVWALVPTFNLDPETPKSSVEFYYISWEKLDPEKIVFFNFF